MCVCVFVLGAEYSACVRVCCSVSHTIVSAGWVEIAAERKIFFNQSANKNPELIDGKGKNGVVMCPRSGFNASFDKKN